MSMRLTLPSLSCLARCILAVLAFANEHNKGALFMFCERSGESDAWSCVAVLYRQCPPRGFVVVTVVRAKGTAVAGTGLHCREQRTRRGGVCHARSAGLHLRRRARRALGIAKISVKSPCKRHGGGLLALFQFLLQRFLPVGSLIVSERKAFKHPHPTPVLVPCRAEGLPDCSPRTALNRPSRSVTAVLLLATPIWPCAWKRVFTSRRARSCSVPFS